MTREPSLAGQCVLVVEEDYYMASDVASTLRGSGADVVGPFPLAAPAIEAVRYGGLTGAVVDINLGSVRLSRRPMLSDKRACLSSSSPATTKAQSRMNSMEFRGSKNQSNFDRS